MVKMVNLVHKSKFLIGVGMTSIIMAITANANALVYYESVGANGEPRYTQHPPTDGAKYEMKEIRTGGRMVDAGQMAGKTSADTAETSDAQQEPSAAEQANAEAQERIAELESQEVERRCQSLRDNLSRLSTGGRHFETDDAGNRVYLEDREVELKTEKVQQLISQFCSG